MIAIDKQLEEALNALFDKNFKELKEERKKIKMGISPGINYYLKIEDQALTYLSEKMGTDKLHIGESSFGWCFTFNTIPRLGLTSLKAWEIS